MDKKNANYFLNKYGIILYDLIIKKRRIIKITETVTYKYKMTYLYRYVILIDTIIIIIITLILKLIEILLM